MASQQLEQAYEKYRYEALFGVWLVVTGATFMRIKRQPYSMRLKVEQCHRAWNWHDPEAWNEACCVAHKRQNIEKTLSTSQLPSPLHQSHRRGGVSISEAVLNPWNPLYAVAPFIIVTVSVPLAIFAVATTSIALSLLAFRGFIVYTQLGTALLGAWLSPTPSKPVPVQRPYLSERSSPPRNRNRRNSSNGSGTSLQDSMVSASRLGPKSGSFTALLGEGSPTRDYEGVGGWRDTGNEDEEALWMGMNSRLQLPAATSGRRHQRRHTGGQSPTQRWSWSPEVFRMSPVQSRARTPIRVAANEGYDLSEYFPRQPVIGDRPIGIAPDPSKRHSRRLSGSGSSIASVTSSMMTPVKEAGEPRKYPIHAHKHTKPSHTAMNPLSAPSRHNTDWKPVAIFAAVLISLSIVIGAVGYYLKIQLRRAQAEAGASSRRRTTCSSTASGC
ncbi:hypothetical protein C7974DRAFT_472153 [Boeremia exigua]|uniref:uncharacterized protein n=1 Tax=Boeremia exigua TaxID=749465 RepID=UPI001E8D513A|nr:uncharacterized protein C7974DRAFT_472153 [Boeremia exigua]KAH6629335.1 hypothetical protein C7974DRAFT_472153 [Boeremia exigua]